MAGAAVYVLQHRRRERQPRPVPWLRLACAACAVAAGPFAAWVGGGRASSSRGPARGSVTQKAGHTRGGALVAGGAVALGTETAPADDALRPSSDAAWPSVGVVIATYERSHLVLEALQQIAAQDYAGSVDVVVVDDSTESLEPMLAKAEAEGAKLPATKYLYSKERMSIGAKRNLAIRSTDATVLCVWDDDDVFTMDRLRKQVEHLRSAKEPFCSAIEVASVYSVPEQRLHVRDGTLPQLVYENTLCFTRSWWESNALRFGEPWEVSGQGEGTLQPWWDEVKPLTGVEEPFLYIYLPSSVSGGTANRIDDHPEPSRRLFGLVSALRAGRFPDHLSGRCPHVRGALAGARQTLASMLDDPALFSDQPDDDSMPGAFEEFRARYMPVRERHLRSRR